MFPCFHCSICIYFIKSSDAYHIIETSPFLLWNILSPFGDVSSKAHNKEIFQENTRRIKKGCIFIAAKVIMNHRLRRLVLANLRTCHSRSNLLHIIKFVAYLRMNQMQLNNVVISIFTSYGFSFQEKTYLFTISHPESAFVRKASNLYIHAIIVKNEEK